MTSLVESERVLRGNSRVQGAAMVMVSFEAGPGDVAAGRVGEG